MRRTHRNRHKDMKEQLDLFKNQKEEVELPEALETIVEDSTEINSRKNESISDRRISIKGYMQDNNPTETKINNYENFSITRKLIEQLPYVTIQEMFYGINNMHDKYTFDAGNKFEIGKLYERMNPTEIMAFWTGIGRKTGKYYESMRRESTIDIISKLVSIGHNIPNISANAPEDKKGKYNIGTVHGRAKKNTDIYSTGQNEMKKRLSSIDAEIMQEIANQLKRPRRYLESERNTQYGAPGYDSTNLLLDPTKKITITQSAAKREYIDVIMNIVKSVYDSHMVSK